MSLEKTVGLGAWGWYAEVYTDDGDTPMWGRWYGKREACEALDPRKVKLWPLRKHDECDAFDLACERRME